MRFSYKSNCYYYMLIRFALCSQAGVLLWRLSTIVRIEQIWRLQNMNLKYSQQSSYLTKVLKLVVCILLRVLGQVQGFRLTQHCFEYFIWFPPEDGHTTQTCSGYWIKYSNQCCVRRKPWIWPYKRPTEETHLSTWRWPGGPKHVVHACIDNK
jgi:hypothetical protein